MASSSSARPTTAGKPPRSPESYESLSRRNAAAEILQSYEKLSWYSFQRCESIVQTRLHFQNIIAGFTEQDEDSLVDWKEDRTPRPKLAVEGKSSKKGKERPSSASVGDVDPVAGSSTQKPAKSREKSKSEGGTTGTSGNAKKKRRSTAGR